MIHKAKKYFLHSFVILLALAGMGSCTTMDAGYKDFIKNGETSYTGTIDSVKIFSGHNRVQVNGLFMGDPKITELRIFWSNNSGSKDSLVVPVTRTSEIDSLLLPLPNTVKDRHVYINFDGNIIANETTHNFEIRTYDKFGNKSVAVIANGKVYGSRYQTSINNSNRPISSVSFPVTGANANQLTIKFGSMDTNLGVYETDVTYTSAIDNLPKTVSVPYFIYDKNPKNAPIINDKVVIPDCQNGSFSYVTLFRPNVNDNTSAPFIPNLTCIDTFSSLVNTVTITNIYTGTSTTVYGPSEILPTDTGSYKLDQTITYFSSDGSIISSTSKTSTFKL